MLPTMLTFTGGGSITYQAEDADYLCAVQASFLKIFTISIGSLTGKTAENKFQLDVNKPQTRERRREEIGEYS